MSWVDKRYQLIEDMFTWGNSYKTIIFGSDDVELVEEYIQNSNIKNKFTSIGGKNYYILDKKTGNTVSIEEK